VSTNAASAIAEARARGGRVWAIGTTSVRTLETAAAESGTVQAIARETNMFLRPPYTFRAVDHLITNFHLPKTSLLIMVSAFAGYDLTMEAYRVAMKEKYRFFSYGDAMLLYPSV